jgi:putative ABC transport system substrate-binding protein
MGRFNPALRAIFALVFFVVLFSGSSGTAEGKTIGVILTGDTHFYREIHKAFTKELARAGFGPDKVEMLLQTPAPNSMAWTNAARKLVAVGVDIIVTYGAPATIAVVKETSGVPIVFAGVYDPEALGVKTKNSTGISSKVTAAGLIKTLKGIADFSKLGVVYNDSEQDTVLQAKEVQRLEGQFAYNAVLYNIKKLGDASKITDVGALFITTSCSAQQCIDDVVGVSRKLKVPTGALIGGGEEEGVIVTVSPVAEEQGERAAEIVVKILKGAGPAGMPVESPKKIEMIINMKEASRIGIKIPFDILTGAARVIK